MPYHPANLAYQPYAPWRVIALAWIGKLLGVQFHVHGIPFGAAYRAMPGEETELGDGGTVFISGTEVGI